MRKLALVAAICLSGCHSNEGKRITLCATALGGGQPVLDLDAGTLAFGDVYANVDFSCSTKARFCMKGDGLGFSFPRTGKERSVKIANVGETDTLVWQLDYESRQLLLESILPNGKVNASSYSCSGQELIFG